MASAGQTPVTSPTYRAPTVQILIGYLPLLPLSLGCNWCNSYSITDFRNVISSTRIRSKAAMSSLVGRWKIVGAPSRSIMWARGLVEKNIAAPQGAGVARPSEIRNAKL
jgi:hypothetical protein